MVTYDFWVDSVTALRSSEPGAVYSMPAFMYLLFANILLTSMQWYWTWLIFAGIADKFGLGKKAKAN